METTGFDLYHFEQLLTDQQPTTVSASTGVC